MMELSLEPVKMEVKEEPTLTPCLDSGLDTVSQLMTHPTQDPLKVEVKEEPCDDHTYSTIAPSPQLTPGVASTSNSSESSLLLSEGTSIKDEDILIKEDFVEDEDLTATTTTFIPKPKSNEYECPDHGRADVSLEEFTGHLQVHTAASQPLMQVPGAQKAGTTSVMSSPHQEEADPGIKRTSSEVEVIPVGACAGRETLWLPAITEHFLELVIANFKKIQDKVTKKKYIWKAIALELNSKFQISLTADQCHNKWRNLLKSYKKFADNTKATGAAPMSKPPYYDKLHGIIHDSHAVNPKNTISSGVSETPASTEHGIAPIPTTSEMPALPEGIPGTSSHSPGVEESSAPLSDSDGGNEGAADSRGGGGRQEHNITRVRLTPASHNAKIRRLLQQNSETLQSILIFLKEKEKAMQEYRERKLRNQEELLHQFHRYNNILKRKRSKKRRRSNSSSE